jgi:hypothetical protein
MQDHYAGDIGDYVKVALLRKLGAGKKLGVAWYLYPDEPRDGGHTSYLNQPRWQHLEPDLFAALKQVVARRRSVEALEMTGMLDAVFSRELLVSSEMKANERDVYWTNWFERVLRTLRDCNLVFADPDNGLADAIVYHHNSRFRGGHCAEIQYWLQKLGNGACAVRARAFSCRTFFIVNADIVTRERAIAFCEQWAGHGVEFHPQIPSDCASRAA